jgi:pilus assembly protein Flp/PilA
MARLISQLYTLRHDDKGATAIEYGLIATLVSVIIIGALQAVGGSLGDSFQAVSDALTAP